MGMEDGGGVRATAFMVAGSRFDVPECDSHVKRCELLEKIYMTITRIDYGKACEALRVCWEGLNPDTDWKEVKVLDAYGEKYLRISKTIGSDVQEQDDQMWDDAEVEIAEKDDEALIQPTKLRISRFVDYDVVHSPSYQVPVLYIIFKQPEPRVKGRNAPPTLDEVYDLLVPACSRPEMEATGTMGALSMTDHPTTGLPAYFVHPCRTAEAMAAVTGGKEVEPVEYLLTWLGLVGPSVGLNVPLKLVEAMRKPA